MLSIIDNTLFLLLISLSFPIGYLIGTYTEREIEDLSDKISVSKILNIFFIMLETAVLLLVFIFENGFYTLTGGIIIVLNLCLVAFYTSIKADFVKIVGYGVFFIVISLILSTLILLI